MPNCALDYLTDLPVASNFWFPGYFHSKQLQTFFNFCFPIFHIFPFINIHQPTQMVLTVTNVVHPAQKLRKPNGWAGLSTSACLRRSCYVRIIKNLLSLAFILFFVPDLSQIQTSFLLVRQIDFRIQIIKTEIYCRYNCKEDIPPYRTGHKKAADK